MSPPPPVRLPLQSRHHAIPQLPALQPPMKHSHSNSRKATLPLPTPEMDSGRSSVSDAESPAPVRIAASSVEAQSVAPVLPAVKWQRGEDGSKLDSTAYSASVYASVPAQMAPVPPINLWAHLSSGPSGLKKMQVKREQKVPAVKQRASLLPGWPEADMAAPPAFRTAFDLLSDEKPCLSLGDAGLDAPLQGGLREGVTELVGEAACGKTQLAMQLMLQCQLPKSEGGLEGGALYLAVEEVAMARLRSLAASFQSRHPKMGDMLNKIYIKNIKVSAKVVHGFN
jgi:hypothetical protein